MGFVGGEEGGVVKTIHHPPPQFNQFIIGFRTRNIRIPQSRESVFKMSKLFLLVQVIFSNHYISAAPRPTSENEVGPRPGFSSACRGAKSIAQMVTDSEVVVEAGVVAVSPVRNNIYAVTLKVEFYA